MERLSNDIAASTGSSFLTVKGILQQKFKVGTTRFAPTAIFIPVRQLAARLPGAESLKPCFPGLSTAKRQVSSSPAFYGIYFLVFKAGNVSLEKNESPFIFSKKLIAW
jgi:hypothetical protein